MSGLTDALEAYELAIARGAPSIDQADAFADLTAAHRARMNELTETEGAIERVWNRPLPHLEVTGTTVAVENRSSEHEVAL